MWDRITGPVNEYYFLLNGVEYYIFSDVHMPMFGKCKQDSIDITEHFSDIFVENKDKNIDIYIENRYFLDSDTSFYHTKNNNPDYLVIPRIYYNFFDCIDMNSYCHYPNTTFHHLDIRYGIKDSKYINRNIFSAIAKAPPNKILIDLLQKEYWEIFDYYFINSNNFQHLNLFRFIHELSSSEYNELRIIDDGLYVSPIIFNLRRINQAIRDRIIDWSFSQFSALYEQFIDHKSVDIINDMATIIFDSYVLSKILIPTGDIKIIYMGGIHVSHCIDFFETNFNIHIFFSGQDPNFTPNIIKHIFRLKQEHPFFKQFQMHSLFKNPSFISYIHSKIPEFQCIRK